MDDRVTAPGANGATALLHIPPVEPTSLCPASRIGAACSHWPVSCQGPAASGPTRCSRTLAAGGHLYHAGAPVEQLWLIIQGSIKTVTVTDGGDLRVTGFYFTGDFVGWHAVPGQTYLGDAVALEPCVARSIALANVLEAAVGTLHTQRTLLDGLRRELERRENLLRMEPCNAEERLARFLVWLAHPRRGAADAVGNVNIPMSRVDIGNYLGLAVETVSRRLTAFHERGVIDLRRRSCRIVDRDRLNAMAGP